MSTKVAIVVMVACVGVAVLAWFTRPQERARALFPLGFSAIMGAKAVEQRDPWQSMALSVLAIALFLASLWLRRGERQP